MRAVVPLVLALGAGCAADVYPEAPYFESCTSDASCGSYRCLPWSGFGTPRSVCSQPCTSAADCPAVIAQHCGTLTSCVTGVCGYRPCR